MFEKLTGYFKRLKHKPHIFQTPKTPLPDHSRKYPKKDISNAHKKVGRPKLHKLGSQEYLNIKIEKGLKGKYKLFCKTRPNPCTVSEALEFHMKKDIAEQSREELQLTVFNRLSTKKKRQHEKLTC